MHWNSINIRMQTQTIDLTAKLIFSKSAMSFLRTALHEGISIINEERQKLHILTFILYLFEQNVFMDVLFSFNREEFCSLSKCLYWPNKLTDL